MSDRARAGVHVADCRCSGCAPAPEPTDWTAYRKCSVCAQTTGQPCMALSGRIILGRPDSVLTPIGVPHAGRKRRSGR